MLQQRNTRENWIFQSHAWCHSVIRTGWLLVVPGDSNYSGSVHPNFQNTTNLCKVLNHLGPILIIKGIIKDHVSLKIRNFPMSTAQYLSCNKTKVYFKRMDETMVCILALICSSQSCMFFHPLMYLFGMPADNIVSKNSFLTSITKI